MQDVCRFIITFRTPISISTPHTYISTGPFLPFDSPLSSTFSAGFTKGIKMQRGKLLSWPAPPLEWIGHTDFVCCVSYSPNGRHVVSGSWDKTIRIWDAETGAAVGEPITGHVGSVSSIAYSPDGQHIVSSGSQGKTVHVWSSSLHTSIQHPSPSNLTYANLRVKPDPGGWVRDSKGGLLYWVPPDCRVGLHEPAFLTIPLNSPARPV